MAILDYHHTTGRPPAMSEALLLCAPGAACEAFIAAGFVSNYVLPGRLIGPPWNMIILGALGVAFFLAIPASILSLVRYARRPFRGKPWFVYLNLAINAAGIAITGFMVVNVLMYGLVD